MQMIWLKAIMAISGRIDLQFVTFVLVNDQRETTAACIHNHKVAPTIFIIVVLQSSIDAYEP